MFSVVLSIILIATPFLLIWLGLSIFKKKNG